LYVPAKSVEVRSLNEVVLYTFQECFYKMLCRTGYNHTTYVTQKMNKIFKLNLLRKLYL